MDKILREAAQQALESLLGDGDDSMRKAVAVLRAALAQPDDKAQPAASSALGEVIGCFEAALAEGLQEALASTEDERLKDLVERRLMHALYAAQNAAPQQAASGGWLEAAVAWEVCASVHEKWAKGKDALYTTRHNDFVRHAEDARARHWAVSPLNAIAMTC